KSALGDLKGQLHTDSLTKIHNRKWMTEHLLDDGNFKDEGILVFIDLDKFKPINDIHGHVVGDKVLQYFASFLKSQLKEMDVIRYAGDEFLAVLNDSQMEACFMKMKKLQESLLSKKLKASNGELLYLAFSFGITRFDIGSSFRDVLEIADSLMYENKKLKRRSA
ncbi:GGDEF domain-containing protein, partial [Sulfurimonas sp. MAG313]